MSAQKQARPPLAPLNNAQGSTVYPPSLPANLARDSDQDYVINSIGFYSDLLGRLDDQIKTTEEVYLISQYKVAESGRGCPEP